MFIWVLLWFLFSAIVAMVATIVWARRPLTWLAVALLISPVVAMAILLIVADVVGPAVDSTSSDDST